MITRAEAAKRLGVSERTLYRAELAGTFLPVRPTPRVIWYKVDANGMPVSAS